MRYYISIEKNIECFEQYRLLWAALGFNGIRANTITEGIQKLMTGEYLYVGINSDAVDFMPLLRTMRSVTNTPIFIVTSIKAVLYP